MYEMNIVNMCVLQKYIQLNLHLIFKSNILQPATAIIIWQELPHISHIRSVCVFFSYANLWVPTFIWITIRRTQWATQPLPVNGKRQTNSCSKDHLCAGQLEGFRVAIMRWIHTLLLRYCRWKKYGQPVEVGSLSDYLQGFSTIPGGISSINSMDCVSDFYPSQFAI